MVDDLCDEIYISQAHVVEAVAGRDDSDEPPPRSPATDAMDEGREGRHG